MSSNAIPRRAYVQKWTSAEQSIKQAVQDVEAAGCHPLLTDAINLLHQAFEKVADFTDAVTPPVDAQASGPAFADRPNPPRPPSRDWA